LFSPARLKKKLIWPNYNTVQNCVAIPLIYYTESMLNVDAKIDYMRQSKLHKVSMLFMLYILHVYRYATAVWLLLSLLRQELTSALAGYTQRLVSVSFLMTVYQSLCLACTLLHLVCELYV
jgi:hypothetical protein